LSSPAKQGDKEDPAKKKDTTKKRGVRSPAEGAADVKKPKRAQASNHDDDSEIDHDNLVGAHIRKRTSPACWRNGVITSIILDKDDDEKKCQVEYESDSNNNKNNKKNTAKEILPIDETLDLWIIAHKMFNINNKKNKSSPKKDGKDKDQSPALFQRKSSASQKPYTLKEFENLLEYALATHGGATLQDLEASKLIQAKANAKGTEVYGRMLPGAIHVRFAFSIVYTQDFVGL